MRILFAEDNIQLRELFIEKLKDHFTDIIIEAASSGNEAIGLLNNGKFYDVIVSDYEMENGSGADLLGFKLKNNLKLPFIFFTSTINPTIPYSNNEYMILDKSQFPLLLSKLEKISRSLDQNIIFQNRIKEMNFNTSN